MRTHSLLCGAVLAVALGGCVVPAACATEEWVLSHETCGGLFLIPLTWTAEFGRTHDLVAVFDTGGTSLLIDPDALERASGKRVREGTRVRMPGVSAGPARFTNFRPHVRSLDPLSRALGRKIDVFLPFRTFRDFLLTLDYSTGELRVSPAQLPRPDGVEVFSARGDDRRPWLQISIAGRRRSILIDSGSNGSLSIEKSEGLRWVGPLLPLRLTQQMKRLELEEVGRLDETIRVGGLVLRQPIVSLTSGTETIGSQVLRYFVVSFDQENRRMRLHPVVSEPVRLPAFRGSGAVLKPLPNALEVFRVLSGTPADKVGVQVGDRVTKIDGRPVYGRGCRPDVVPRVDVERWTIVRSGETFDLMVPFVDLVP